MNNEVGYAVWMSDEITQFINKHTALIVKKCIHIPIHTLDQNAKFSFSNEKNFSKWFEDADKKGEHAVFVSRLFFNETDVVAHITIAGRHFYIQLAESGTQQIDFSQIWNSNKFPICKVFDKCPMMIAKAYMNQRL